MSYYILDCITDHPVTTASYDEAFYGLRFMDGTTLSKEPKVTIECYLDTERASDRKSGIIRPFYNANATIPLMRKDLLEAVLSAGVDNLVLYPAILHDKCNKTIHDNYVAVNIIGSVRCADAKGSRRMGLDTLGGLLPDGFESLKIDEQKADGVLMFRLAESLSAIVVHEKVKRSIEASKIPYMYFQNPAKWAG
jgi:hypothetical protein